MKDLWCFLHSQFLNISDPPPHSIPQQPLVGQGILINEASGSHSETLKSVELLWTSAQSDAHTPLYECSVRCTHTSVRVLSPMHTHLCTSAQSDAHTPLYKCSVRFTHTSVQVLSPMHTHLCTSAQSDAHTPLTDNTQNSQEADIHFHAPRWDSKPQSKHSNDRRTTP